MRKIFAMGLAAVLVAAACSSSVPSTPGSATASTGVLPSVLASSAPAQPAHSLQPGRRIAIFVPWTQDVWYVVGLQGAREKAAALGIQLDVYDANNKVETQVQQWDLAMAKNPEAMVLSSVDPGAMVPSVEKAHDAGIKVVAYDRPIYATSKLDGLLVLDLANLGDMQCKAIVQALITKNGSPKGTVVRQYGDLTDTWVTGMSSGWDPCIAKYPDIKVLKSSSGAWDPALAASNVSQLLVSHPEIDVISLDSDWLGSGILTDLKTGGYGKIGEPKHIYLVGASGMPIAFQAIRDGWMDVDINNPVPDFFGAAVELADMVANGEPIPQQWTEPGKGWSPSPITYNTPTSAAPYAGPVLNMANTKIDKTNVDDPTLWGNLAATAATPSPTK